MAEWISVNDRLPDKDVDILFYIHEPDWEYPDPITGEPRIRPEYSRIGFGCYNDDKLGPRFTEYDEWGYSGNDVTHWMYLPDPPVEE